MALFADNEIEKLKDRLVQIRKEHFNAPTATIKRELRDKDRETTAELFHHLAADRIYDNLAAKQIAAWNPYDQNTLSSFFDAEWMFGLKDGFDIVIGNPPYGAKTSAEEKTYFKEHYEGAQTKNGIKGSTDTFVMFIEKGHDLLKTNGNLAYIVPMSVTSSDAMCALHKKIERDCGTIRVSSYSNRPQQIFDAACIRTSIFMLTKDNNNLSNLLTTKIIRRSKNHPIQGLIDALKFVNSLKLKMPGRYPKIGSVIEKNILEKCFSFGMNIDSYTNDLGKNIYYRAAGGRYWNVITNYSTHTSAEKFITCNFTNLIGLLLSSSVFFFYQQVYTDGLNIKRGEIGSFPLPKLEELSVTKCDELESLYEVYLADIEKNANIRTSSGTSSYKVGQFKEYKIVKSKPIIDKIDDLICPLYGLTQEETDFIKNYEIEARMSGAE